MEKILKTEIELTEYKFRKIMIYEKICEHKIEFIIKLNICIFIVIAVWILKYEIVDCIFCTGIAILGLIDIFKINKKKRKDVNKLEYEFFQDEFYVSNGKEKMKAKYEELEKIIVTKKYFFIFHNDEIFVMEIKKVEKEAFDNLLKILRII